MSFASWFAAFLAALNTYANGYATSNPYTGSGASPSPSPSPSATSSSSSLTLPVSNLSFASSRASSKAVLISDANFHGTFIISSSNPGIINFSVSNNILFISPVGAGSTVLTVSDGTNSATINITVNS